MCHLQVLGSLGLRGPDGEEILSVLAQPKRTAILAYLAVACPRDFHRRDELAGIFWPESDQEHARASLRVAVHFLRRSLGENLILSRGDEEIGLDFEQFSCDAAEFQEAIEAQDLERGLRLYRGDLLAAFFLVGCPEFDRWLALERERLRELAAGGAWALAHRYLGEGRITDGERMGQRAVGLVGTDENEVRRFIEALATSGDRAAAVRFYERFAGILRDTLELDPSPETVAVIEAIRDQGPTQRLAEAGRAQRVGPSGDENVASVHGPPAGPPSSGSPVSLQPAGAGFSSGERRKPWALLLAGAAVTMAAVFLTFPPFGRQVGRGEGLPAASLAPGLGLEPLNEMSPTRVAIFPGRVIGADSGSYFGEGLSDVLYQVMSGVGGFDVVDPNSILSAVQRADHEVLGTEEGRSLARYFGAGLFVLNRVNDVGGQVGVTASLYRTDAPRAEVQETFVEGRSEEITAIGQQVALDLFAGYLDWGEQQRITSGQFATVEYEALRAYLEGLQHYRGRSLNLARAAFNRAIAADSSFSLAWFARAMMIGGASASGTTGIRSIEDALRHASGLSQRDSTLLEAARAFYVDQRLADELTGEFVSRYPTNTWGWYWRGITQIWFNWRFGRPFGEAWAPIERLLTLEPNHTLGLIMLHWVATAEERFREEDSLATVFLRRDPDRGQRQFFEDVRALRSTEGGRRSVAILDMEHLSPARIIQIGTWDWRFAEVMRLLTDSSSRSPGASAIAAVLLAHAEAGRGRWLAASEYLDRAGRVDPGLATAYRGMLAAESFLALEPSLLRRVRDEVEAWDGLLTVDPIAAVGTDWAGLMVNPPMSASELRTYVLGLLDGRLGNAEAARVRAGQLEATMPEAPCTEAHVENDGLLPPPGLGRDLALEIRAVAAMAEGDTLGALGFLQEMGFDCCHPYDYGNPFNRRPFGRFLRAELLRRTGQDQRALGWLAGFASHGDTEELLYQPIVYLRRAQLEERLGRRNEARGHYEKFIEAWRSADPHLQVLVAQARERLRVLD